MPPKAVLGANIYAILVSNCPSSYEVVFEYHVPTYQFQVLGGPLTVHTHCKGVSILGMSYNRLKYCTTPISSPLVYPKRHQSYDLLSHFRIIEVQLPLLNVMRGSGSCRSRNSVGWFTGWTEYTTRGHGSTCFGYPPNR